MIVKKGKRKKKKKKILRRERSGTEKNAKKKIHFVREMQLALV